ncbi:uncharacterized protein TNCV_3085711 [Trichonephila clavipes]|nr:uncharacterized protein TNCV_3085711 [Trichonephila clavipes]
MKGIILSESDCEESEESADVIDNIPVISDSYVTRDWILHNSNVPGRFVTRNDLRQNNSKLNTRHISVANQAKEKQDSNKTVGRPEVRAPDSLPEGLGSMPVPPNTLPVHTEFVLIKSVGPKVLWAESRVQVSGEYFPPLQFHA